MGMDGGGGVKKMMEVGGGGMEIARHLGVDVDNNEDDGHSNAV